MAAATLTATNGRAGVSPAPSVTFTHVLDNAPLASLPVTSQPFTVSGNPLLVCSTGSAMTTGGLVSYPFKLNSAASPAAGTPEVWINPGSQHFPLVRSWALVPGVAAGQVTLTASAGNAATVPNGDDTVCASVWELGPGAPLAVRAVVPPTSAQAIAQGMPVLYQPFVSFGGRLLIRASGSAQESTTTALISFAIDVDGQEVARSEIQGPPTSTEQNGPWHHATVPVDVLLDAGAGPHVIAMRALSGTATDLNDYTSVLVLEQVGPPGALEITPVLVNAPCLSQNGGGTAAFATFASGGGTLVILASASAWSTAPNVINLALQLDGQPLVTNGTPAVLHGGVNTPSMHIPLISNDFVATGIGAGNHTLTLVADSKTTTDPNDRVSITVMELGPTAG